MNEPEQNKLEYLHQLRNARWQHLIHLKKENERKDRCLELVISWAQEALLKADKALAIESFIWTKSMLRSPDFEKELEADKQDIIEDYDFYTSWLM